MHTNVLLSTLVSGFSEHDAGVVNREN